MDKKEFEEKLEQVRNTLSNWSEGQPSYTGYICFNLRYVLDHYTEKAFINLLSDKYDNGREQIWGWFGSPTLPHNQCRRVAVLDEFKELYMAEHYPSTSSEASDSILSDSEEKTGDDKGSVSKQA